MRRCCFWAVLLALPACSTFEVTPFLKEQITGDSWKACLAREYQAQARFQARYGRNWHEATLLSEKGRAALAGAEVATFPVSQTLSPRKQALDQSIGAMGLTCNCAKAQAALDGWVLALEQDPHRDQTAFAAKFEAARADCAGAK